MEEDIEEMRAEERAQQSESSISIMELICSPTLRAPLIIGIVMQLSQQLSGINAVSAPRYPRQKTASLFDGREIGLNGIRLLSFSPLFNIIRYFTIPLHSL